MVENTLQREWTQQTRSFWCPEIVLEAMECRRLISNSYDNQDHVLMYITSLVSDLLWCPTLIPVSNDGCKSFTRSLPCLVIVRLALYFIKLPVRAANAFSHSSSLLLSCLLKYSNQEYLAKCIPGEGTFDTTIVQCILIACGSRGISQHLMWKFAIVSCSLPPPPHLLWSQNAFPERLPSSHSLSWSHAGLVK